MMLGYTFTIEERTNKLWVITAGRLDILVTLAGAYRSREDAERALPGLSRRWISEIKDGRSAAKDIVQ